MLKKLLSLSILFVLLSSSSLEEGMFPLSEISKIDLKEAGLKIPTKAIYNPNGTSLVQALVRVGGCTGSFVSEEGLIITNHHCAFGAVAAASDKDHDYITDGFYASDKTKEIKTSIKARITESYEDVSEKIMAGTDAIADPAARTERIKKNIADLEKVESDAHPDLLIEVSEMLTGKIYTLFRYRQLNDIRLVYVPPRSVGEFGGESDNWVWPRHTGDFSFMRAYVGKDGSAAEYSEDNVPYKPKQYLQVNAKGVKENDFVFILGYPGRTYRNQPKQFLDYQYEHQLPYISEWFDYQIDAMHRLAKGDKEKEIRFASRIKRLANVTKNYKGKLQGLNRTTVMQDRAADDKAMQELVDNNPKLKEKYGTVLSDIGDIYAEKMKYARRDLWLYQVFGSSGIMSAAAYVGEAKSIYDTLPKESRNEFIETFKASAEDMKQGYTVYDNELEKILIKELLYQGTQLPKEQRPKSLNLFASAEDPRTAVNEFVDKAFEKTVFTDKTKALQMAEEQPRKLLQMDDALVQIAGDMRMELIKASNMQKERDDKLSALLPKMVDLRLEYKKGQFLPDANSTLRFTYGYIKRYSPEDAEIHLPFTSIKGILQKASDAGDYFLEDYIQDILENADPESVVCFLYNLDTTGGNSGSPIMDAKGQLVGVNFDRSTSATINDFAWNEEYSRSIGVDIRYVLLILKKLAKADNLLEEMKVS